MTWTSGHHDNSAFPFRAYAAYNQGSKKSEDVIASVDFRKSDLTLAYSADIGLDDGTILVDGPSGTIDIHDGVTSARVDIAEAFGAIVRFLEANAAVIYTAMRNDDDRRT
jgi:hypothetical protein